MRRLFLLVLAVAISSGDLFAAMRVVALTGQPAPGTGGFTIASLGIPLLNEAGNTAFQGTDNAISTINNFIWSEGGGGGTAIAAHEGSPAAGTPFGVTFGDVSFFSFNPNLSENGSVALTAPLTGTGVTTSNDSGIWRGTNSATLQLLGREGSPAPGMPSGVNFNSFGTPKINSGGSVVFTGTLIGSGITTANDSVLWTDAPGGGLVAVAQEGTQAAGLAAGLTYGGISSPTLNDNGRIAFNANVTGADVTTSNDEGIWRTTSGTNVDIFAREGDHAPGTPGGDNFYLIGSPVINNAGHLAFASNLAGPDIVSHENDSGIWSDRSGQLALEYRAGNPIAVPQLGQGYTLAALAIPAMNHNSRLAFYAVVAGPTTTGVFLNEGRTGSAEMVAATGIAAPGTPDGVTFTSLLGNQNYHLQPAMNARGQMAFVGKVVGAGVTTGNDYGIWATDSAGVLHLIAREGDSLDVDPGPGSDLRTINVLSFYTGTGNEDGDASAFNDSGRLAFSATFVGGGGGVFVSDLVAGLVSVAGDYNGNGVVDAADYVLYRKTLGQSGAGLAADGDHSGTVDSGDYSVWRASFGPGAGSGALSGGAVPEATGGTLIFMAIAILAHRRSCRALLRLVR